MANGGASSFADSGGTRVRGNLTAADMPALQREASRLAATAKRAFLRLTRIQVLALVVAAIASVGSLRVGNFNVSALVSLVAFGAALTAGLVLFVQRPEKDWRAARSIAESTRTQAWKYAVGAQPYGVGLADDEAVGEFRNRLRAITVATRDARSITLQGPEVSDGMQSLRKRPLEDRREVYLRDRVGDQRRWYSYQADRSRRSAAYGRLALIGVHVCAIVLAAGRLFAQSQVEWSAGLAAAILGGIAWLSIRRFEERSAEFALVAHELAYATERFVGVENEPIGVGPSRTPKKLSCGQGLATFPSRWKPKVHTV